MRVTAAAPVRRIDVCADDFGLTDAACRSILHLGGRGALSSTSVAVDGAALPLHLPALRTLRPCLRVGLHLNLTGNPAFAGSRPVSTWIRDCWLGRVDRAALAGEIDRQLQRFRQLFDSTPDFIDGHEHVHQFPVVRDLLLAALLRHHGQSVPIRCTWPLHWRGAKAAMIGLLGARALRDAAARQGLRSNSDFAGVYDLQSPDGYAARMEHWVARLADGGLIMCHPEYPQPDAHPARMAEHAYFDSPAWPALLARQGLTLILARND